MIKPYLATGFSFSSSTGTERESRNDFEAECGRHLNVGSTTEWKIEAVRHVITSPCIRKTMSPATEIPSASMTNPISPSKPFDQTRHPRFQALEHSFCHKNCSQPVLHGAIRFYLTPSHADEVPQLMCKRGNTVHMVFCARVRLKGEIPVLLPLWFVVIMIAYPGSVSRRPGYNIRSGFDVHLQ